MKLTIEKRQVSIKVEGPKQIAVKVEPAKKINVTIGPTVFWNGEAPIDQDFSLLYQIAKL